MLNANLSDASADKPEAVEMLLHTEGWPQGIEVTWLSSLPELASHLPPSGLESLYQFADAGNFDKLSIEWGDANMIKAQASFDNFAKLDIRIGTIVAAERAATNKPTYRMSIDFGPDVGLKISCGAYTNYPTETIIGKQVVAVLNFGAKKMGPEVSEALVLGVHAAGGDGTIFLTPERLVENGSEVF